MQAADSVEIKTQKQLTGFNEGGRLQAAGVTGRQLTSLEQLALSRLWILLVYFPFLSDNKSSPTFLSFCIKILLLHCVAFQLSTALTVREQPLLCLSACMCFYPGKQRIHWVPAGLELDSQEGRARVCTRREGNQFPEGLTVALQQ